MILDFILIRLHAFLFEYGSVECDTDRFESYCHYNIIGDACLGVVKYFIGLLM